MLRWLRWVALGVIAACGGGADGDGPTPRAGEPCTDGSAARCGIAEGSDEALDAVLACEGGTWTQLLSCGDGEHCYDDSARGAVVCTSINDEIVYGQFDGPCDVAGGEACSIDRDYAMTCEAGSWAIATNCESNAFECALLGPDDDPPCDDPDGCVGCRQP